MNSTLISERVKPLKKRICFMMLKIELLDEKCRINSVEIEESKNWM